MTTATIPVGTRVRVNDKFGTPPPDISAEDLAMIQAIGAQPNEKMREQAIGLEGAVVNVAPCGHWRYDVQLDTQPDPSLPAHFLLPFADFELDAVTSNE